MEAFFEQQLKKLNIKISTDQDRKLLIYYDMLISENEKINLTAITEKAEVYKKHFWDSLTPALFYDFYQVKTLCDVGSGAGFPSIVLKIFFPHLKITIIEALEKRVKFLNNLVHTLQLEDVTVFHARAEDFAKDYRETFDIVTARAVARLNMLAELCIPLLKVKGDFIVLKGQKGDEELAEAQIALKKLGICQQEIHHFMLDENAQQEQRQIIILNKCKKTSVLYPRHYSKIKKQPLK